MAKTYETKEGKRYTGDRKADALAGPDSIAGKLREHRQHCSEGAAELGLCTKRESQRSVEPSRSLKSPQYGRSRMDAEDNQDTLD